MGLIMDAHKIQKPIKNSNIPTILLFGAMVLLITTTAFFLSGGVEIKVMILLLGIISSAICFFNTEMALYLILFAMLFSPEFSLGEGFAEGRSLIIRIEDVVILIVFISWLLKTTIYKGIGLFVKTPLNQAILIYIGATLFSTLLGAFFGFLSLSSGLLYVFKYMEYFLVFFLFINNLQDKDQINRFIIAAFIVAIFTALYAIIQIPQGIRVSAPFEGGVGGEPNTLGGYLLLIVSIAIGLLMNVKNQSVKRYLVALIVLLSVPFFYTFSRSSYIAVIPLFLSMFFLTDKKVIVSLLLITFLLVSPFIIPKEIKERVTGTFVPEYGFSGTETIGGIDFDPSTSARITSFKRAVSEWSKRPLFGWGVTGIGLIDSMYFRTLAETGLLGLSAFFYLIYKILLFLYSTYKEARDNLLKGLSFGMLLATMALIAHSIGAATFIIVRIMEPYWFFMAIVFVFSEIEKKEIGTIIEES